MKHALLLVGLALTLLGCATSEQKEAQEREIFAGVRDSEIGKTIQDIFEHNSRYYIFRPGNDKTGLARHVIEQASSGKVVHSFITPYCSWSLTVDSETQIILAWAYLGDSTSCKYKKNHEGPW